MLPLLLVIACFPQFITSSNLALTFDAANSTCTAACSTCSDTSNTDTTTSNSITAILKELLNTTSNATSQEIEKINQRMDGLIASLSHIKDTTTTNAGAINDILLLVEDLLMLHVNDSSSSSFSPLPTSCQEIKNKQPNSPSGVYLLAAANDGNKYAYCNMEKLCGSGGGWTRLAYLDMTDSTENCPSGFRLYQSGGVRVCGRATSSVGSCTSVQFPPNGISYSQVCGRVVGYQFGTTNADDPTLGDPNSHNDINSYYVDGVSITRGSPRQHVWTLMAGLNEASILGNGHSNCLVLKVVFRTQLFSLSLVMTTTVNLVILLLMGHFSIFSTHLIHCGMVKDVVVLKVIVVQLLVSHGSIRSLTLPLLTTLS